MRKLNDRDFGGGWWLRHDPVDELPLIIDHPNGRVRLRPFSLTRRGSEPVWDGPEPGQVLELSSTGHGVNFLQIKDGNMQIGLAHAPFSVQDLWDLWTGILYNRYEAEAKS